ncbi:MAG: hypothetical protein ACRDZO_20375 [Egibacteraceae bacterium]
MAPTLTRDQYGAYIYPVSFDLTTTLYQEFGDGGIAVEPGARNMGVNKEPYVYDSTLPCRTEQPTDYYATVDGTLEGTTDPDVSFKTATVTLACGF